MAELQLPLVHVSRPPDDPPENAPAPAVVFLHGFGGDEHNMIGVADSLPDDLHAFGVRAPFETGNGYSWVSVSGQSRGGFQRGVDALASFAGALPQEYDVDSDRVGLFGFSQGAKTALAALVDTPERYRWAAALNGFLPDGYEDPQTLEDARGEHVFITVGENDDVIGPRHGEDTAELLTDAGLDVTFRSYPVGHRMTGREFEDISEWLQPRY